MKLRKGIDLGVATHTGLLRGANEDDYLVVSLPEAEGGAGELLAIADGMGGAAGGAEASRAALRALAAEVLRRDQGNGEDGDQGRMRAAFAAACRRVFEQSKEVPTLRDMGTTLTAVLLRGARGVIGHVGDTRAYLLRDDELSRLTTDHAVRSPDNYLTRCIGGGQAHEEPDLSILEVLPGDRLALLSDGVWSTVDADAIKVPLMRLDPQEAADQLIRLANSAGGPDNSTAIVVHFRDAEPGSRRELNLPREEAPRTAELGRPGASLVPPRWPLLAYALLLFLFALAWCRLVWGIDLLAWLSGRV